MDRGATSRNDLDLVAFPSPCSVPWDSMEGTDGVRLCRSCAKPVYDVAMLNTADAVRLAADETNPPCLRVYRDPRGRVLTRDRPAALPERIWRRLHTRSTWAASLFAVIFLSGCRTQGVAVRNTGAPAPKGVTSEGAAGGAGGLSAGAGGRGHAPAEKPSVAAQD